MSKQEFAALTIGAQQKLLWELTGEAYGTTVEQLIEEYDDYLQEGQFK